METDKHLYNITSCLRDEYKEITKLKLGLMSLKNSLTIDNETITEYDNPNTSIEDLEVVKKKYRKVYIDSTRLNIKRTEEYIKQVKEEIANFPPYPELPPTKPLIKITGMLEDVSFKKVIGYFDQSEYSTEKEAAAKKISRDNKGAALLLLLQTFSGNIPHAPFNDGRRKQYKCIYVKGILDGKVFSGWLNKTNIKVGDKLEMAVMPEGDEYRMYAVANPQQGIISTPPGCLYGSECGGNLWSVIKVFSIIMLIIYLVLMIISGKLLTVDELPKAILSYITLTVGLSFSYQYVSKKSTKLTCDLFEKVCDALNISGSKSLDLDGYSKKKFKEMNIDINSENYKDVPQYGGEGYNKYDFYYYPPSNIRK